MSAKYFILRLSHPDLLGKAVANRKQNTAHIARSSHQAAHDSVILRIDMRYQRVLKCILGQRLNPKIDVMVHLLPRRSPHP